MDDKKQYWWEESLEKMLIGFLEPDARMHVAGLCVLIEQRAIEKTQNVVDDMKLVTPEIEEIFGGQTKSQVYVSGQVNMKSRLYETLQSLK